MESCSWIGEGVEAEAVATATAVAVAGQHIIECRPSNGSLVPGAGHGVAGRTVTQTMVLAVLKRWESGGV